LYLFHLFSTGYFGPTRIPDSEGDQEVIGKRSNPAGQWKLCDLRPVFCQVDKAHMGLTTRITLSALRRRRNHCGIVYGKAIKENAQ
jgi:hypothetical protein